MNALKNDSEYMRQCIDLARLGKGHVAPNPMVGAIIVKNERVIGKGYHQAFGGPHAEVNALDSVVDKSDLPDALMYVNLEPCVHHGKTPPCCDRIIESGIRKVVVSAMDINEKVQGRGLSKLRNAGVEVISGVLQREEEQLNVRFRTYHKNKRPYIILKWAQSADGFMDIDRRGGQRGSHQISNDRSRQLVHQWRAEEQAILIGANTALNDNPQLNVRHAEGPNPIRLVIDMSHRLPNSLGMFHDEGKTIIYSTLDREEGKSTWIGLHRGEDVLPQIMKDLYDKQIQSLIVEGGRKTLMSFLNSGLWDEARVFTSPIELRKGLPAPDISGVVSEEKDIAGDRLTYYFRL